MAYNIPNNNTDATNRAGRLAPSLNGLSNAVEDLDLKNTALTNRVKAAETKMGQNSNRIDRLDGIVDDLQASGGVSKDYVDQFQGRQAIRDINQDNIINSTKTRVDRLENYQGIFNDRDDYNQEETYYRWDLVRHVVFQADNGAQAAFYYVCIAEPGDSVKGGNPAESHYWAQLGSSNTGNNVLQAIMEFNYVLTGNSTANLYTPKQFLYWDGNEKSVTESVKFAFQQNAEMFNRVFDALRLIDSILNPVVENVPPLPPQSLSVENKPSRQTVILSWSPNYEGRTPTGYNIYLDGLLVRKVVDVNTTSVEIPLNLGENHYFTVQAYNDYGLSGHSERVDTLAVRPNPPGLLNAQKLGDARVRLTWLSSDNATGYQVFVDDVLRTVSLTTNAEILLNNVGEYQINVKAYSEVGVSGYSVPEFVTMEQGDLNNDI